MYENIFMVYASFWGSVFTSGVFIKTSRERIKEQTANSAIAVPSPSFSPRAPIANRRKTKKGDGIKAHDATTNFILHTGLQQGIDRCEQKAE